MEQWHNGMVQWNGTMEWYNGMVQWNSTMEWYNGTMEWYNGTMVQWNDTEDSTTCQELQKWIEHEHVKHRKCGIHFLVVPLKHCL